MNILSAIRNLQHYVQHNPVDAAIYLIAAIVLLTLGLLYFQVRDDDGNWDQFIADHHCQLKTDDGGKSHWFCDNGKIYYRWRQQR